jgi:hypothetical protein
MSLVDPTSLSATVDAVNEALFLGRPNTKAQRAAAAQWIAARQGLPGSYAGMFAPTEQEFVQGVQVFTGERMSTRAGTAHILGEEACRALILLDVPSTRKAIADAGVEMIERLADVERRGYPVGLYCCRRCSVALWRHLAVGGLAQQERRLAAGLAILRSERTDNGRWRTFPFHYTVLALSDIALPAAAAELRHAAPALERVLEGRPRDDRYHQRRRTLAERVLASM